MSVTDPSIALSGGGLTLQDQANAIFGNQGPNWYPTKLEENDAAYLELTGAASAATVQQTNVSEPPNFAAAAALLSQVSATMHANGASAAAALQLISAATTLTMTAD